MNEHTKSLLQAILDGKKLEYFAADKVWKFSIDNFAMLYRFPHSIIRVKQQTISIGTFEFPEPERVPLKHGEIYYLTDLTVLNECYNHTWTNSREDDEWLRLGLIHKTIANAKLHVEALIKISGGTV